MSRQSQAMRMTDIVQTPLRSTSPLLRWLSARSSTSNAAPGLSRLRHDFVEGVE